MNWAVGDDEQLYRRVQESIGQQLCYHVVGNQVVFSHAAFNDPKKCPSLDRAILKGSGDPHLSRKSPQDGIVCLQAATIRRLGPISKLNEKGKPTKDNYDVDVKASPLLGNCSHALVVTSPPNPGAGAFKRLKEGLARLATQAGWTVQPQSALPKRYGHQFRDTFVCLAHHVRGHW
jgi:hypothetical protein